MDRKDFFKNICKYGACSCAGLMLFSPAKLLANDQTNEENKEDWRIGFIQERMASLIEGMDEKLDEGTMTDLLETMGRQCAKGNVKQNKKYKGNLNGYLKKIENSLEKLEHDERRGIIKIVGKRSDSCFCPFVDNSKMKIEFCNCTKGWQKETYEYIIGKPVDVKINESILWGSDRCGFTIKYGS